MYTPKHFLMEAPDAVRAVMERYDFATLVTAPGGVPVATHLPFLFDAERGVLESHMARANPQWRDFENGAEALVIFQGPHAYISPAWYDVHPSVPTWNYAAVHAYGVPVVVDDEARVEAILHRMVEKQESHREKPWVMDLPPEYLRRMAAAIVAFEIPLTRVEGKAKMSQNRAEGDRRNVIAALETSADTDARGVAETMRRLLSGLPPFQ